MERGSSAVECRTRNQVSPDSNTTSATILKFGHFRSLHDALVHSTVQMSTWLHTVVEMRVNSRRPQLLRGLNASKRSRFGAGVNRSASRGSNVKRFESWILCYIKDKFVMICNVICRKKWKRKLTPLRRVPLPRH